MMNVLKHPSLFRPTNQPSPAPSSVAAIPPSTESSSGVDGDERAAHPLNRLSLGNFRRPSSAPNATRPATPVPLIRDSSYLEMLSLRLSEAVTKALAQPTGPALLNEQVAGRRPIPANRGHAFGALLASELNASHNNPHLHRAILRSLHRPLSVLLTNLSAHLLPLLSASAFHKPPAPTLQSPNPNPTQLHALAIATFAGELLETFDCLDLGRDGDIRGDGLKPIREGLISLINRAVGPLVAGIRSELMPLLEALEIPITNHGTKTVSSNKVSIVHHPSIVTMQAVMPIYARALARYTTSAVSQTALATFLISAVWRGLVALSHRPRVVPSPPASPGLVPQTIKRSPTLPLSVMHSSGRFAIKIPPSYPPSQAPLQLPATAAVDARALCDLLNLLPRPRIDEKAIQLAREAVDEAFEGLQALPLLLEAVDTLTSHGTHVQPAYDNLVEKLEVLTTEVPLLIALPVLLHVHGGSAPTSVGQILGLSESEYRKECLHGFGRAEECAIPVALRVIHVLRAYPDTNPVVSSWLEMEIAENGESVQ